MADGIELGVWKVNEIKQNCQFAVRLLEWGRIRYRSRVLQTSVTYRPVTVCFSRNRNVHCDFCRIFSFGTGNTLRKYSLFLRSNSLSTETQKQNYENARSRMLASLRGSVGTGTRRDESSTGRVWAAGLHHVTARDRLARGLKITNHLFL